MFVNISVDPAQLARVGPNLYLQEVGNSQNRILMAKRLSSRIRPKNQITLPQRLVDHVGLKEGDFLDFEIVTAAQQVAPGMIVLRTKRLIETEVPVEPVPPVRDEQEFPGVKTAIAELKKRLG